MVKREDAIAAARDFLMQCRAGKFRLVELVDLVIRYNRLSHDEVGTTDAELNVFWAQIPYTCYVCDGGRLTEIDSRTDGRKVFQCSECKGLTLLGCVKCSRPANAWANKEETICMICGVGHMLSGGAFEALQALPPDKRFKS